MQIKDLKLNTITEVENTKENVLHYLKNIPYKTRFNDQTNAVAIEYNRNDIFININKITAIEINDTMTIRCKGISIFLLSEYIITMIL
jgi:hypothetical protein